MLFDPLLEDYSEVFTEMRHSKIFVDLISHLFYHLIYH